jgi:hypothetical protein
MQEIGLGEAAAAIRASQAQPAPSQNGPKRKRVYERILISEEDLRRSDRRVRRTRTWPQPLPPPLPLPLPLPPACPARCCRNAHLPPSFVSAGRGRTSTTMSSSSTSKPTQRCAGPPGRGEQAILRAGCLLPLLALLAYAVPALQAWHASMVRPLTVSAAAFHRIPCAAGPTPWSRARLVAARRRCECAGGTSSGAAQARIAGAAGSLRVSGMHCTDRTLHRLACSRLAGWLCMRLAPAVPAVLCCRARCTEKVPGGRLGLRRGAGQPGLPQGALLGHVLPAVAVWCWRVGVPGCIPPAKPELQAVRHSVPALYCLQVMSASMVSGGFWCSAPQELVK